MAELSDEARASYKRAAEAVIAAGSEDRATVNEAIRSVIDDARKAWPSISDEDLASFFQSQALLMTSLAHLDVMRLSTAIDLVFRNCTMAASVVAGAYDLDDNDAPKRDLSELAEEAQRAHEAAEDAEYGDPTNLGMTGGFL
jgi:predicted metal-dependent hydrolase